MPPSLDCAKGTIEKVIKMVLDGDVQAYGILYDCYYDEIYRYVYYRVARSETEAEDLTQIVFIRAWKVVSKKKTKKTNFRSLVYRIAHNLVIDYYRTRKNDVPLEKKMIESMPSNSLTPEELALEKDDHQSVLNAIRELEPQYQDVLICRFINGLSHAETAKILDLSVGHVRVLQHRALKRIQVEIK